MTKDTLTIKVNGEDRDLFMSYGLLTKLSKAMESAEHVGSIPHDPDLRDGVLEIAITPRSKTGKATEEIDLEEIEISIEDVEKVLDWVMEHLTGFFVRGLAKTKRVLDQQTALNDLFSETGSEASTSKPASSGPSE